MEYPPAEMYMIKKTVEKDLTDTEFGFLMHQANTYNLDPFLGEIWAVKYGTAPARVFVGLNGLLKVGHETGAFDGMESGWEKLPDGDIKAWTKVYRKDASHPFFAEVLASEYEKDTPIWKEKRVSMTVKVSKVHALRLAFPLSGMYIPEEFGEAEKPPMKDVTPPSRDIPPLLQGEPQGERDYIPTKEPIIEAKEVPVTGKRQVKKKVGGKWQWVDE